MGAILGVWEKKLDIMRHYDASARVYDLQYGQEQRMKMEFALKVLHLKPESSILDVGCGTGLLFEYLSDKVKISVGVDISKNILMEAKRKLKGEDVFLIRADADYLPFPNEIFDVVFAITLLQNMPSPSMTLREMRRVAKLRASILVTGLKKSFGFEEFRKLLKGFSLEKVWNLEDLKDYVALLRG